MNRQTLRPGSFGVFWFTRINRTHSPPHPQLRHRPSREGLGGVRLQNLHQGEAVRSPKSIERLGSPPRYRIKKYSCRSHRPHHETSGSNPARTRLVGAFRHSYHHGNVTDPPSFRLKLHIQTLHMQITASQRFVSHHETAVASFDMSRNRPRFEGRPAKGSRPPHVKQS